MPAHARAPPLAAAGAGARARVRVPYPAWFFLNRVSRVWVTESIPASPSGSEPPRQRLSVNRRGGWTVLKEGSENLTDSLIELLSESGTSEEEYSSTSFFLYSGCSSKVKANILPKFVFIPLLQ